ncbi:MAG: hypothetical protein U0640_09375 [Phycisphaerales bacterium]
MSQMPSNASFETKDSMSAAQDTVSMLSVAAARGERRNKPTFVVALGVIALVASVAFAGWSWFNFVAARNAAEQAKTESGVMLEQAAQLQAMIDDETNGTGPRAAEPATNVLSKIEASGARAGLKKAVPIGSRTVNPDRNIGWNQVRYSYNIKDESLDALLRWAQFVQDDVPSLEVYSVTLRPEATEWSLTIVFSRWEKPEGS